MDMIKKMLFAIVILVLGLVSAATASTYYTFQPDSSDMYTFDGNGNVDWSGLFDTIERYNPGSHRELYTHSEDAVAGGTALGDAVNNRGFFAGQGLSLDFWGNLSGIGRHGNEKFSAVVAALAGFLDDDRLGIGADINFSFNTFGSTYSPVSQVPLPGSLWFLFSGLGMLGVARRGWWRK
jgi:hypothetical protein